MGHPRRTSSPGLLGASPAARPRAARRAPARRTAPGGGAGVRGLAPWRRRRAGALEVLVCLVAGLVLLPGGELAVGAAGSHETNAFTVAAEEYNAGYWVQAEADCNDFARKYPRSARLPDVYLFQALARFHLTNYAGAIELLSGHQAEAGGLADTYVLWQAKALQAKGDSAAAADMFGKLIERFPSSPRALEAGLEEARARATLGQWDRVVELLLKADGAFQQAARTNAASEAVASGWLLLGEAQLARKNFSGVEPAVEPLARLTRDGKRLTPSAAWRWQYLLARLRLAQGRPEEVLANSTNLVAAAAATADPAQQAETHAFLGELLARRGRGDDAINAYTNNLAGPVPAERQAQALRRVTELLLGSNQLAQAAARLEDFAARLPDSPSTPLALLLLGELRLREQGSEAAIAATNAASTTNHLGQAAAAFIQIIQTTNKPPPGPLVGRAELDLGWCYWLQAKWPECQAACQAAIDRLPLSPDQATARFKLADALFEQKAYGGAITQYDAILERYGDVPQVRTNLWEPALYQETRAALAKGDLAAATNALAQILAGFPNGFHADRAALLAGQEVSRRGDAGAARAIFAEALRRAPDAALSPALTFALARTYERDNQLPEAIAVYKGWQEKHPASAARPSAEYYLALDEFLAGNATNALARMTNFVARYPADPLTPYAQWWLGDYYYRYDNQYLEAERRFQDIYKNTNLPPSELTYGAQLMAGRAALRRQGYPEAINHFTNLTSDAKCPFSIRVEAMIGYGDAIAIQDSANKLNDYEDALRLFSQLFSEIKKAEPTNPLAAVALGAKANCYLQLAQQKGQLDQLTNAAAAYEEAMRYPGADAHVRSMAEVGWGMVVEKQAASRLEAERKTLLNQALGKYLDVFFKGNLVDGEQPDPWWIKEAGVRAGQLAEDLGLWSQARSVYQRLAELLPPLRPQLEKKMLETRAKEGAP